MAEWVAVDIGGKQTDITGMKITKYPMGYIDPRYKAHARGSFNNADTSEKATSERKERRTKTKAITHKQRKERKRRFTNEQEQTIAMEKLSIPIVAEKYGIVESTVSRFRKKWRDK